MIRVRFWSRLLKLAERVRWTWLAGQARRRKFRAELRLQKLDVAKLKAGQTSDERDAAVEEGVASKPKRARVPKPPKRSASA